MNTPVTLLEAEFPLDKWEGQLKGDQPHLNVEAPAPEKTTLWDGYIKICLLYTSPSPRDA